MNRYSFLLAVVSLLLIWKAIARECSHDEVRLVGGSSYLEGRVEVCLNDRWATVCDDGWDNMDADVVCGQLGYSATGATALAEARFGQGSGLIGLTDLQCNGNESSLFRCGSTNQCFHHEDAGVRCHNNIVALVYRGQVLANNSLLSLENLSTSDPISCVSTLPSCCNTTRAGDWFLPSSVPVNSSLAGGEQIYQSWSNDQTIRLHRSSMAGSFEEGLYRCEVPDAENVMQTLFVGIYPTSEEGAVNITSLVYQQSSHMLVCTSSGGPATSVTWTKDGVPLSEADQTMFRQSQLVVDSLDSVYENRLDLLNKSSSHSGSYACTVANDGGEEATATLEVEVCRENELRLRLGEDQVTSSVQVCEGDSWRQSIETPLRIPATAHAPRNVRVTSQMNGFSVTWELGASSSEVILLSHEVTCSSQDRMLTISATADGPATTVSIPVQPSPGMLLECCVLAVARRTSTIGALVAEECATGLLGDSMASEETVSSTMDGGEVLAASSDQTLLIVLSGVVGVLFLVVVVVMVVLVATIVVNARNKMKGDSVEEMRISEQNGIGISLDCKETKNPIYDSVESSNTRGHLVEVRKSQPLPPEHSPVPARGNVQNPMYTSIEDLQFRRTSFSVNRCSPSRDVLVRRNSTSAVTGRRIVSTEVKAPVPTYSMIVPRHLRKKDSSPMEGQEDEASQPDESTSNPMDSMDDDQGMYSKLQH